MTLAHGVRVRLRSTRTALGDRQMARLLFTWGAWVTTDWAFLIVVSVMALRIGGPAAVGLVGALRVLPAAALSGVVAVVSDRLPRPLLLAVVNAAWCVIALVMAWFASAHVGIGALLIVISFGSAVSSLLKPCLQALLPQLVNSPSQLIVANSAYSTTEGAGTILGPAVCGALLAGFGPAAVFVVLAFIYTAAAVTSGLIKTPFRPARRVGVKPGRPWLASLEGFRLLLRSGTRTIFALFFLQATMRGLLNVFVVLFAVSGGGSEADAGGLFAAVGVGGLIGAVVALGLGGGRRGVVWFALGISFWGAPFVVIGVWNDHSVAYVALAVVGLANAFADIYGYSLFNRLFPDHLAGRAWGAFYSGNAAAVALGSVCAPVLVSAVGLSWAMMISGTVLTLAPVVLWPRLRAVQALAEARAGDVELFRALALFSSLSLIAIERLARAAHESEVAAGSVVVRQGDLAEEFFVIVEGDLSVWQDEHELRRLGPGGSFGEIGLLETVHRTASVRADTPSRLLSLDSYSFIAAVTGHSPTGHLARDTVDQILSDDAQRVRDRDAHPPPDTDGR